MSRIWGTHQRRALSLPVLLFDDAEVDEAVFDSVLLDRRRDPGVVSRARLPRKSQQEPFSMGLLGEALFDASAICLSRSGMLPKRARIAPWQARISQTAPAFPLARLPGHDKGYFGKAVRERRETRHDRPRREKIVISGTDGSVRRHPGPLRVLASTPLPILHH